MLGGLHGGSDSMGRRGGGEGSRDRAAVDLLPRGSHCALPVRSRFQCAVPEQTSAADAIPGLAHDVTDLMAEQFLSAPGGEIRFPRRERDPISLRHRRRARVRRSLAFVELQGREVHTEAALHPGPDRLLKVQRTPKLFARGGGCSCAQLLYGRIAVLDPIQSLLHYTVRELPFGVCFHLRLA